MRGSLAVKAHFWFYTWLNLFENSIWGILIVDVEFKEIIKSRVVLLKHFKEYIHFSFRFLLHIRQIEEKLKFRLIESDMGEFN